MDALRGKLEGKPFSLTASEVLHTSEPSPLQMAARGAQLASRHLHHGGHLTGVCRLHTAKTISKDGMKL